MFRREFLKTTHFGSGRFAACNRARLPSASDKPLRVALIGCGWYGKTDLLHLIQVAPVEVVGLCDVDSQMLATAAELVSQRQPSKKKPTTYADYDKLLAAEQPGNRADRYARSLALSADGRGVQGRGRCVSAKADQLRRHRRAGNGGCGAEVQPHRAGRFAAAQHAAFAGSSRSIHSQRGTGKGRVRRYPQRIPNSPGSFPPNTSPPANLDWDTYVGPAKWREYNPAIHPRGWRNCREFSNGQTGDLCVHFFDVVRYFLDLGWPRTISASGGMLMRNRESTVNVHDTQTASFRLWRR